MGLTTDLNVSIQSLLATTQALDTTTTNIANANTPGYARRRVNLVESAPVGTDGNTGVNVQDIQSLRDNVLDLSVNAATSQQSLSSTISNSLSPVQAMFSDQATGSVGASLNSFFNSLQQLSTSPSDGARRASVVSAAKNLASSFQSTATLITQTQQQADQSVVESTRTANTLLQQIAVTNGQIQTSQKLGRNSNSDQDQLASLLTQLSGVMDYNTVNSSQGLTLTTDNGTPLVVGNKAYALTNSVNANGYNDVYAGGKAVTSSITGGSLGGALQVRDQTLATMKTQLDTFAYQFAKAVNGVQDAGYDAAGTLVHGTTEAAFFNPPDTTLPSSTGAASSITFALTSSQIAAATSSGAPGDNTNLVNMINLQNQAITNSDTPSNAFSSLTFSIGNSISQANSNETASGNILAQLKSQQGSIEGVSIDEESSNLILYQRSYQAAAKIISTIDTLMGNVLNMGVGSGGY